MHHELYFLFNNATFIIFALQPIRLLIHKITGSPRSSFEGTPMGSGVGLASLIERLQINVSEPPSRIMAIAKFAPVEAQAR